LQTPKAAHKSWFLGTKCRKNPQVQQAASLISVYPFSRYEYIISTLLARNVLTFDDYLALRDAYIDRNLFLYVFEISAPRGFGDTWAFSHWTCSTARLAVSQVSQNARHFADFKRKLFKNRSFLTTLFAFSCPGIETPE
jgi:hypothetical protein